LSKFSQAEFDDYGNITNYTQLLNDAADALNAAKDKYNKASTEADQEAASEVLETAQKNYDKQLELLQRYEDTLDAYKDQEQLLEDLRY
jgi:hypothetical protein